jgi:hypothetical protein
MTAKLLLFAASSLAIQIAGRPFVRGDYAGAVERLAWVRHIAHESGGSHAQCDLIQLTFLEALCERAGPTLRARWWPSAPRRSPPAASTGALGHVWPDLRRFLHASDLMCRVGRNAAACLWRVHFCLHSCKDAGVPVLTFVSCLGGFVYECQNQRDTSKYKILVLFWI